MSSWSGAVIVALAIVAFASPARAQDQGSAQADFEAASRAWDHEDYEEALRLFRQAFEAAPRAAVRFNIAVCLERLGRLREAWQEYRAAIAPGDLTAEQLERAEREAERLRAMLATVEVTGRPTGADVRIDGISVCAIPCTTEVDPGQHTISAHANGASADRGVRADRGQRIAIELDVRPPPDLRPDGRAGGGNETGGGAAGGDRDDGDDGRAGVGWLTIVGASVAAIGVGGIIGFGLHTQALHDEWLAGGPDEVRDQGLTMRAITNVSIGVAILGGVLVAVDLLLAASGNGTGARAANRAAIRF